LEDGVNRELSSPTPLRGAIPSLGAWLLSALRGSVAWFSARDTRYVLVAMAIGIAFGSYFVMRYGGHWAEHDSRFFVAATDQLITEGQFLYDGSYTHGYTYPVWLAMLSLLTGLEPGELTRFYTPIIGNLLIALISFATFRRFLNSQRLGLLATTTIFLVPELVFTASRGNHEKLAISLTLLTSLAILRSFSELRRRQPRWNVYTGWTVLFYLAIFALISVNIIFGLAVLGAWTVTLFLVGSLSWGRQNRARERLRLAARRLGPLIGSSWILAFLIAWYVYPPMKTDINHLKSSFANILVFLTADTESTAAPYTAIQSQWLNQPVYRALTLFRWILFAGSGLAAAVLALRALWRPQGVRIERIILLGLYITFGLELALSVVADFSGLRFGDNLQVRFFTYFGLFATPMFVLAARAILRRLRRWLPERPLSYAVGGVLVFLAVASMLKATLDPLVSNNWIFYHPAEIEAMRTWAEHSERRTLYIGDEIRLFPAWIMTYHTGLPNDNFVDSGAYDPRTAHAFNSRIKQAQASAWLSPLSPITEQNRVYDNGEAQIFHRIPQTPLQR
jgi:hypothetical protein